MGFAMGMFFSSLGGPMGTLGLPEESKGGWKKQTVDHFKHMGRSGVSMMKVGRSRADASFPRISLFRLARARLLLMSARCTPLLNVP